jgi:hypothetical protein
LYTSVNIIRALDIKQDEMGGISSRLGAMRNVHKNLAGKPEGKKQAGTSRYT